MAAKKRRMAYLPPALDEDLRAMAEDLNTNINALLQKGAELLVEAWRDGRINEEVDLYFNVEVRRDIHG